MERYARAEAVGRRISREPFPELARPLVEKIKDAVADDRRDDALDMLSYWNERSRARRGTTIYPFRVLWWWINPGYIAARSGEESIEEALRKTMVASFRPIYERVCHMSALEKLHFAAEMKRAELAGSGGQLSAFFEEPDRYVLSMDPCGSAGRSRKRQVPEEFPNSMLGDNLGSCSDAHTWTWSRRGVNYRCLRCCMLNEILPIEWDGYPLWVTDYQEDPNAPCRWLFYLDRDRIPESYFARVGKEKPRLPDRPN